ncbi:copper chaperone PCu(A)C [Photobacterium sanctipauli]|uniref:Copper chaperone PCu(A)C n=1 Tax=Photobacterium sanctipauli TaxID=1342794 RepID=A0A2T3NU66_9GAMM|nr:copper chaperone PCu(A)C [Photobacterium sanctipauli]PSW19814.1 copper chaperone PCu(A)C [Photobacterium sanctipauli]
MKTIQTIILTAAMAISGFASAHEYKTDSLHIDHPWSKQVPPTSSVAAAFFSVMNHGDNDDVLLGASSPIAEKTELHAHIHENGMMKMREVEQIEIPAHGTQMLKPGGYHIMFFGLNEVPKLGDSFPVTLNFKQAGMVEVDVKVEEATYMPEGGHSDKEMDHSHH